jgi:hypothetical protein
MVNSAITDQRYHRSMSDPPSDGAAETVMMAEPQAQAERILR